MQSDRPKQYLPFCGKTILEHTLDRLLSCPQVHGAIVIIGDNDPYWSALKYQPAKPLHIAEGGVERQDSVINGLSTLTDMFDGVFALVHDAVRPLVPGDDLIKLIKSINKGDSGAILASPVADTLKRQNEDGRIQATVTRDGLWRALTPQIFDAEVLLQALQAARDKNLIMTDDASAMEAFGYQPLLVEGSDENIKITRPGDLRLAELIWKKQQGNDR